jgi:hypothetical protein
MSCPDGLWVGWVQTVEEVDQGVVGYVVEIAQLIN